MRTIDENTLKSYKNHLYIQEKSKNTIDKYIRDIRTFTVWLQTQEQKDITKDSAIHYKKHLEAHYKPSSTNSMLTALNGFFEYMGWHDCRVKTLKTQPNHIYAQEKELTRDEYEKLVTTAEEEGNQRLALLMETLGCTGIRVGEIGFITVEAVKDGKAGISFKGKHRWIYLVHDLKMKLLDYCKKQNIKSGAVFITKNGNLLDRSNIWMEMKEIAKKAGVALEKVFPHNLRHFFARAHYKAHKNISHLADILGHSSINTTRIYAATTEKEHIKMIECLGLVVRTTERKNTT